MKKIIVSFLSLSLFFVSGCSRLGILGSQSPKNDNQPAQENAAPTPAPAKDVVAKAALNEIYNKIRADYKVEGKFVVLDEQIDLRGQADFKTKSWWTTAKGYNVLIQNSIGFLDVNYGSPKDLADVAENVFLSKGFKLNKVNSSVSKTDVSSMAKIESDLQDYTRAYILDDEEFCLITALEASAPWKLEIGCFNDEDMIRDTANQTPFLLGLKTDNKKVVAIPVRLGKTAAKLNIIYRTASSSVVMKKTNNNWEEVYRGETDPECSLMTKLQIPKEIYENCVK